MEKYSLQLSELENRIENLRTHMRAGELDAVWISHHVNMYYFSGTAQSGHLFIPADSGYPTLLVRKYFPRAQKESPWPDVRWVKSLKQVFKFISDEKFTRIGLEMDILPAANFLRIQRAVPNVEFLDISREIRQMRAVKSEYEIACIKRAAQLLDDVFSQIPSWIQPGMTELALAARIEYFMRCAGHQGYIPMHSFNSALFYGNVLCGTSGAIRGQFDGPTCGPGLSAAIPGGAGRNVIQPNQPIFIDMVSGVDGYLADATRVFCLGELPEDLQAAHTCCIDIQNRIIAQCNGKITGAALYEQALEIAAENGYAGNFMGPEDDQVKFIAHGLGLEIDEPPLIAGRYEYPLPEGSVIALEPKMVFSGKGAVGIENTWFFDRSGWHRMLSTPDSIILI